MATREATVPEDHRTVYTPRPAWGYARSKWDWSHGKLGYSHPNVLWTSLHEEFNCMPVAIQDHIGWHSDVSQLSQISDTKEEFEAALRKRRDERFNEIQTHWEEAREQLTAYPHIWEAPPAGRDLAWATFCRIARAFSFDTITGHFANYLVDDPEAALLKQHKALKAQFEAAASAVTAAPAPSSASGANALPAAPSTPPEQAVPVPQPAQEISPPQCPHCTHCHPPTPVPATKTRQTKTARVTKGPARPSRVEKPPPKQRTSKAKPREGVRRSARLQERVGRGSG
ncbi:hypothetical protein F5X98DRAFT_386684 [Xylaria grammica]|nr:hypothetical protein F5X98DRAFT_386684 [Xylaria grammica]